MKINKFKALTVAVCCAVSILWSEAKGAEQVENLLVNARNLANLANFDYAEAIGILRSEMDQIRQENLDLRDQLNRVQYVNTGPSCAKAWVVFNGSATILDSYGVSSVIRNETGIYTINFSQPFNSTNYCSSLSASDEAGCGYAILATSGHGPLPGKQTNNSFVMRTFYILNWQAIDPLRVSACFYGN